MKFLKLLIYFIILFFCIHGNAQQPFTAGNIVVYRVGDGSTVLSTSAAPVFLDEYTPDGVKVQSISIPAIQSGSNSALTSAANQQEGMITRSVDGRYLIITGGNTPVGTAPGATGVVIGRVDFNAAINTSTVITDYTESNNLSVLNTAVSIDGQQFWFARYGAIRIANLGSSTSSSVAVPNAFVKALQIANNQLYTSLESSPRIRTVGTGVSSASGQTLTGLPGFISSSARSPFQFSFIDLDPTIPGPDVLYIADLGNATEGGIRKLSLVNGNWVQNGIVGSPTDQYLGLMAVANGNTVTIFGTRQGNNTIPVRGGELVKLVDNSGYNGTLTGTPLVLDAVANPNTMGFRGVALVPQPAPFKPGNILVYRIGDGSSTLINNQAAPVFLDEYSPAGTLVQSIKVPSATVGANKRLTAIPVQQEGMISLSADGRSVVFTGGNNSPGSVASNTGVVIGKVDYNGAVNTTTHITDYTENAGSILSTAVSDNGNRFWFARYDALRVTTLGSSTSSVVTNTDDFINALQIANGQLYLSLAESPRIRKVGNGLPVTNGQNTTGLPGFVSSSARSPFQFSFVDMNPNVPGPDVLYVADLGNSAEGGIRKFSLVNGSWIPNAVIGSPADQYMGLATTVVGSTVSIFATRLGPNTIPFRGGQLVKLEDASGYNGALTAIPVPIVTVVTPNTMLLRGIAKVPQGCKEVTDLAATNVTASQATINWAPSNGEVNVEYVVSASPTVPVSGTATSASSLQLTGLANDQTYYVHVRTICSMSPSQWSTISFLTNCKAPASPSISINVLADRSAEIKWNKVFGAADYEYVLSTSAATPAAGTVIADTSLLQLGLAATTTYYFHIRSGCGAGAYSSWITRSFTTTCFIPDPSFNVGSRQVKIDWSPIPNAVAYEYALTYRTSRPVSGKVITGTVFQFDKIAGTNNYYFHIRTLCSGGGVSEWRTSEILMPGLDAFPNPVRETLQLRLNGINSSTGTITVIDAMGRVVYRQRITNSNTQIDTRSWMAGIYIVLYIDDVNKYQVRLLKE